MDLIWTVRVIKKHLSNQTIEHAQDKAISVSYDDFYSHVVAFLEPEYRDYYSDKKIWQNEIMKLVEKFEALKK